MRELQQQTLQMDDEATLVVGEERTLVAPRFDDEETLVARPVVPLENGAHIDAPAPMPALTARGDSSSFAPRRPWSLALMLVSVLIGGVLGGAGLYLYQRQSQDPAVSPAATTTEQPDAPDAAAQAPAAPVEDPQAAPNAEAQVRQIEPPPADAKNAAEPTTPVEEVPAAARARAPESVPAAERRTAPPSEGTPRRGKKGERDEEVERRAPARPEGNIARDDQPEARQVDTIFYRQRRAERRAERRAARRARRADDADRLRRIFEGPPE